MIKHHDQNKIGVESWSLTVPYNSSSSKAVRAGLKQGSNLKAGADTETMKGLLLTGLLPMACSAFFLIELAQGCTTYTGLGSAPSNTS